MVVLGRNFYNVSSIFGDALKWPKETRGWVNFSWKSYRPLERYFCPNFLTCNSAKKQPLAQIRKFNFEISLALGSILLYLKCIDIWLTPIWTPLWGPSGPTAPKMEKFRTLLWNNFWWKSLDTLYQFTSHFWNFVEFPYYWENWEYFSNFVFRNF